MKAYKKAKQDYEKVALAVKNTEEYQTFMKAFLVAMNTEEFQDFEKALQTEEQAWQAYVKAKRDIETKK